MPWDRTSVCESGFPGDGTGEDLADSLCGINREFLEDRDCVGTRKDIQQCFKSH